MRNGEPFAEGKTKILYTDPNDAGLALMVQKDSISAGDGARRDVLAGKGALSGRTAANIFRLLERAGIPTHFVAAPADDEMVVHRCDMIPLEVVLRRLATGSYLKRNRESREGDRFDPVLVEFFLKDDARHDPQVEPEEIVTAGIATVVEIVEMAERGRQVFDVLERAWANERVQLVDLKIEFGRRADGSLVVADMIDNDSWRLWPDGDKARMLDKQIYRNMATVTEQGLDQVRQKYAEVAAITDRFGQEDTP
ncbi:MAG TPA: phosphoribosylaminoimidazolesuccinocarboxamide synthase [Herpetosiphonaceae bacterium]|nr:phosphoribosylaminoimidazolesuccinocarboxamide synthase [Herpetosiphonaceae bacterium]